MNDEIQIILKDSVTEKISVTAVHRKNTDFSTPRSKSTPTSTKR